MTTISVTLQNDVELIIFGGMAQRLRQGIANPPVDVSRHASSNLASSVIICSSDLAVMIRPCHG